MKGFRPLGVIFHQVPPYRCRFIPSGTVYCRALKSAPHFVRPTVLSLQGQQFRRSCHAFVRRSRSATITALEDAEVACLAREDLERIFEKSLDTVLSWNITYLALQQAPELSTLSPDQLKPMVRAATRMEYVVGQTVTEDRLRTSCGSAKICEAW